MAKSAKSAKSTKAQKSPKPLKPEPYVSHTTFRTPTQEAFFRTYGVELAPPGTAEAAEIRKEKYVQCKVLVYGAREG